VQWNQRQLAQGERKDRSVDALARRYLAGVNCPKTYRENKAGSFEGT